MKQLLCIGVCSFFVAVGMAAESHSNLNSGSTSINAKELESEKKDVFQGDLDDEVADIKLRAVSGAKRDISTSLHFYYSGASLHKPLDDKRPNVGEGRVASPVSAAWNLGVRDRLSKNKSLFFATGFSRSRPFHSRSNEDESELEINTPSVTYNNTFALDNLDMGTNIRLYITTLDYARAIGQVATLGYSVSAMSKSQTRFTAGVSFDVWVTAYDKNEKELRAMQNDLGFGFTPVIQYQINDKSNLYSSWSVWNFSHYRSEDLSRFERAFVTQSIGVGTAIVRDLYLAPNISFYTSDIASDKTSVNLSAVINL